MTQPRPVRENQKLLLDSLGTRCSSRWGCYAGSLWAQVTNNCLYHIYRGLDWEEDTEKSKAQRNFQITIFEPLDPVIPKCSGTPRLSIWPNKFLFCLVRFSWLIETKSAWSQNSSAPTQPIQPRTLTRYQVTENSRQQIYFLRIKFQISCSSIVCSLNVWLQALELSWLSGYLEFVTVQFTAMSMWNLGRVSVIN